MTLKDELEWAKAQRKSVQKKARQLVEDATKAAILAAAEATPPLEDDLSGVQTRSGSLKAAWAADSETAPVFKNGGWETTLANSRYYASYVNDGHRMDKHFVPGLYVNPYSGKLEYSRRMALFREGGITVGTKTQYVPGVFMAEKGEEAFEEWLEKYGKVFLEEL